MNNLELTPDAKDIVDRLNSLGELNLTKAQQISLSGGIEDLHTLQSLISYTNEHHGHVIQLDHESATKVKYPNGGGKFLVYVP